MELPIQVETNNSSDKSNDADVCARQRLHRCYTSIGDLANGNNLKNPQKKGAADCSCLF